MEHFVGPKIKKLRLEHKDTLKSLAVKVDYDWSNLSKVERGVYGASIELLEKITEVYNISPTYFFSEYEESPSGNYYIVVDGIPATEDEIRQAIRLIRLIRNETK